MKLILISYPKQLLIEYELLFKMFDEGLECFHLRKPGLSDQEVANFLNRVPVPIRPNVTLHGHKEVAEKYKLGGLHLPVGEDFGDWQGRKSRSFHSFEEVENCQEELDYAFLSPIFKSISKRNYPAAFSEAELTGFLATRKTTFPLMALGGVDLSNLEKVHEHGFQGAAVLGSIWHTVRYNALLEKFAKMKSFCSEH